MSDLWVTPPDVNTGHGDLHLSDLTSVAEACANSDPGPDPTYDPDPIPDDPE